MTITTEGTSTTAASGLRPRRRALWLLIAAVTAVVLVSPALWVAAGSMLRHTEQTAYVYHRPIRVLRVNVLAGHVSIVPGGQKETRIRKVVRWEFGRRPAVRQSWRGRTLTISSAPCGGGPLSGHCGVSLLVEIPATVAVRVTTAVGQVSVSGLTGSVYAQVGRGSVRLDGIRGPAQVQVGSGSATGVALSSGQVDATVLTGSLQLAFARPPRRVSASTTTGSVTVVVPAGSHYRLAETTGPDVSRRVNHELVASSSQRLIKLSAMTGMIRLAASCCRAPRQVGPAG